MRGAPRHACLLTAILALSACGPRPGANEEAASDLLWQQSRTNTTRYAYLESADLTDEFIFGAQVTNVSGFLSSALNMVVRPVKTKLRINGRKLEVRRGATSGELLMSFDIATRQSRYEVDFASAGNDVKLRGLIDLYGGVFTAADEDGYWLSEGAPAVLGVQQDKDTLVVDLKHTVSQVLLGTDAQGRQYVRERVSERPGTVVVRVFLKRKKTLPRLGTAGRRTVADARQRSIGYFGASIASDDQSSPIQRFALGDAQDAQRSITFYLKDVPAAFEGVARQAITSWNSVLGEGTIKVEKASATIDAGDPRFHVLKWFDGTDDNLSWAGVAKMITEPDTGLVMSGTVYIQGDTLSNLYRKLTAFSKATAGALRRPEGGIGSITFDRDVEETPVIPYATSVGQTYDQYMQGYYLETIAHEVGHVLGLRHNFRGSTVLDAQNEGASVMDYAPRAERSTFTGPGFYDRAALRWGYFGEAPTRALPFCTDEDIWKLWDCTQGDHGDALQYVIDGLVDGTMLLTQKEAAVSEDSEISSMKGMVEAALKITKLKAQMTASQQARVATELKDALGYVYAATPHASLGAAGKAVAQANLDKLKEMARAQEQELRDAGRL